MARFEMGSAWVSVHADTSAVNDEVKSATEEATKKSKVTVQVEADQTKLDSMKRKLEQLGNTATQVGLRQEQAQLAVNKAQQQYGKTVDDSSKSEDERANAVNRIAMAQAKLEAAQRRVLDVQRQQSQLQGNVGNLEQSIKVTLDASEAEAERLRLKEKIDHTDATIKVHVDENVDRDVDRTGARMTSGFSGIGDKIGGTLKKALGGALEEGVDTGIKAFGELQNAGMGMASSLSSSIVAGTSATVATGGINLLIGAVLALSAAVPIAAGAFLALAPALMIAAGAAGTAMAGLVALGSVMATVKLAFGGVSEALAGYSADQDKAAGAGTKTATQALSNAISIRNAETSIADARRSAARSAQDAAARVTEAQSRLVDAQQNAAQRIKDAQKSLAQTVRDSAEKMADSQDRLRQAHADATARIVDAQKNLEQVVADSAERVKDAQQRLTEAQTDSTEKIADAQKDLKAAEIEAASKISDAQARLADAHEQAADRIADAQKNVQNVIQDSADRIASAEDRLAQAHENAAERVESAENRVTDAKKAALDAEDRLSQARIDAKKHLEDLQYAARDAGEDEKRAAFKVSEAAHELEVINSHLALGTGKFTDWDRVEATEKLREAQEELAVAQQKNTDATKANNTASAAGVEGDKGVIAAKDNVNEANAKVADSLKELAKTQAEATKAIVAAEKDLAKTRADAAEAIATAQANSAKIQKDAAKSIIDAEKNLADARTSGATSVENAETRVTKAKQSGAKSIADAEKNLADSRKDASKSTADAEASVVKAKQDAAKSIADAEKGLADARRETSEANARAEDAVTKAKKDGAGQVVAAQKALTQAQQAQRQSQEDGNRSIARAVQALADLKAQQAQQAKATKEATTTQSAYQQAMDKLPPSAQALVRQLISMQGMLTKLKKTAADAMLPSVTQFLKDASTLFPIVNTHIGHMGTILGGVFSRLGDYLKSPLFKSQLTTILDHVEIFVAHIGQAITKTIPALTTITAAAAPLLSKLGGWIEDAATAFAGWIESNRKSGALKDFFTKVGVVFDQLKTTGKLVFQIIGDVVKILFDPSQDASKSFLDGVNTILQSIHTWLSKPENQARLKQIVQAMVDFVQKVFTKENLKKLTDFIGDMVGFVKWLNSDGIPTIKKLKDIWDTLTHPIDTVKTVFKTMKDNVKTGLGELKTDWNNKITDIRNAWTTFWDTGLGKKAKDKTAEIKTTVSTWWGGLKDKFKNDSGTSADTWSTWWSGLSTKATTWKNTIKTSVSGWWGDLKTKFKTDSGSTATTWSTWWSGLSTKATTWKNTIKTNVSTWWGDLKTKFKSDSGTTGTTWSSFWSGLSTKSGTWRNTIKTGVSGWWGSLRKNFTDSQNGGATSWGTFWSNLSSKAGSWKKTILDIVGALKKAMIDKFKSLPDDLLGVLRTVATKINGGIVKINTILPKGIQIPTIPKFADGGHVQGPGGEREDRIPAMLSHNEYVLPARVVRQIGVGNLDALRAGRIGLGGDPYQANAGKFANGGLVQKTQSFIKSTDPLPYVWAAVGPRGYDCSGLTGEVFNRLTGKASYHRRFTTGSNFESVGFKPGRGAYTIGVDKGAGHMVGNLAGLPFEAASTKSGIKVGASAKSVTAMPKQYYLPQVAGSFVGSGSVIGAIGSAIGSIVGQIAGVVAGIQGGGLRNLPKGIGSIAQDKVNSKIRSVTGFLTDAGSQVKDYVGGVVSKAKATAWVGAAMAATGKLSPKWLTGMLTLTKRESNWNPNAVNNWDSNARAGHPSKGIAQMIDSTFEAHNIPGLGGIFNPVANIASAIRYIDSRYGDISKVQQANPNLPPKGYDDGGLLMPGYTLAYNGTGKPEPIRTHEQEKRLQGALAGGGGATYHFHEGAFQVDASKLKGFDDIATMISNLETTARTYSGRRPIRAGV